MALEQITAANIDEAIQGNQVIAIHFWAPDVEACDAYAPLLDAAFSDRPDMVLASCNAEEETEVAEVFKLQAVPTLVVFREQVLVFGQEGVLTPEQLEDLLDRVEGLDMEEVRRRIARQGATLPVR